MLASDKTETSRSTENGLQGPLRNAESEGAANELLQVGDRDGFGLGVSQTVADYRHEVRDVVLPLIPVDLEDREGGDGSYPRRQRVVSAASGHRAHARKPTGRQDDRGELSAALLSVAAARNRLSPYRPCLPRVWYLLVVPIESTRGVGCQLSCDEQGFFEADDGSRTRDLRLGKPTLYQLSYVRVVPPP